MKKEPRNNRNNNNTSPGKRCIKRFSLRINQGKWEKVVKIAAAMSAEKDSFLVQNRETLPHFPAKTFRSLRSNLVSQKYKSQEGLQNRGWKLALKDAVETLHKYWLSLGAKLKEEVKRNSDFDETESHYCHWVLSSLVRIQAVLEGESPLATHFAISEEKGERCSGYLRELLKERSQNRPRVKKSRSFPGEPETYRIFYHEGRQYIALASLDPGKRLVIPLSGEGKITGDVRLVLDVERQRLEVHWTLDVKAGEASGKPLGVDIGVSEVLVDGEGGERYGEEFGTLLSKYSEERKKKGQKRNKLHALEKKHMEKGKKRKGGKSQKKAKKIRKHNLGRKKLRKKRRKRELRLKEEVNRGLNQFLKKAPRVIGCEDLSRFEVKCKSKKVSRLISSWIKGVIRDRIDFKCPQRGSLVKRVNPAYSSQVCPLCGWVERKNRTGDVFSCRFCARRGYSDEFAAKELLRELLRRVYDASIPLWTGKNRVKEILLERFRRSLERWDFPFSRSSIQEEALLRVEKILSTVPGKTPGP